MKTSNRTKSNIVQTSTSVSAGTIVAPPDPGVPAAPPEFVKPAAGQAQRMVLQRAQISLGTGVSKEAAAATEAEWGSLTTTVTALAPAIAIASAWSGERARTVEWGVYCREQEVVSWRPVLASLLLVKPVLQSMLARDPSVANKYPLLVQFFGLRTSSAKKANRNRKTKQNGNAPPAPPASGGQSG
jgi:hypothetical protein